jgi:hypothetical protein
MRKKAGDQDLPKPPRLLERTTCKFVARHAARIKIVLDTRGRPGLAAGASRSTTSVRRPSEAPYTAAASPAGHHRRSRCRIPEVLAYLQPEVPGQIAFGRVIISPFDSRSTGQSCPPVDQRASAFRRRASRRPPLIGDLLRAGTATAHTPSAVSEDRHARPGAGRNSCRPPMRSRASADFQRSPSRPPPHITAERQCA